MQVDNKTAFYFAQLLDTVKFEWFEPDYWQRKGRVISTAQGRGTTYFVQAESAQWVLKHYYRGGMIGRVLHDQYLFTGTANTRAVKEFNLLTHMQHLGLPVPQPIACLVARSGLVYRADLITARIDNSTDIATHLTQRPLSQAQWQQVGHVLAKFHQNGVYHDDLNCHNLLLNQQDNVFLIDFDRGDIRLPGQWQQQNLARLKRSFEKELRRQPQFYWQLQDWQTLVDAYQQVLAGDK